MTKDEMWKIIEESSPEDWTVTEVNNGVYHTVFNGDLSLCIVNDSDCNRREFSEDWVVSQPNHHAMRYDIQIMYAGNCVASIPVISVDGGNACIPMPDLKSKEFSYRKYKVALIGVHGNDRLDEYIGRCKLRVVEK